MSSAINAQLTRGRLDGGDGGFCGGRLDGGEARGFCARWRWTLKWCSYEQGAPNQGGFILGKG